MTFDPVFVKVPEWDLEVSIRPPTLADLRASRVGEDEDLSDAEAADAITDSNIALLCRLATPPLDAERLVSELPHQRLRLLLGAVAEVSGVTDAERFRPGDDVQR